MTVAGAGGIGLICGPWGTGKTLLACDAATSWGVAMQRTVRYATARSLIAEARTSWADKKAPSESKVIEKISRIGLLIIDEMMERRGTADEHLILFDVINRRYGDMRPTLIITNEKPKAACESLGPSIADRIKDGGAVIEFDGQSRRGRS